MAEATRSTGRSVSFPLNNGHAEVQQMDEQGSRVLLVAADSAREQHLTGFLRERGHEPIVARTVEAAVAALAETHYLFSLLEVDLNGSDGMEFLRRLRVQGGSPGPVIALINGNGTGARQSVEARALGAEESLRRPFSPDDLERAVKQALSRPRRVWCRSNDDSPMARVEQEVALWRSPKMQEVWKIIQPAARVDVTVLITGETGTGKDVVARAIHYLSARQARPFIKMNCAAVPRDLLESDLFGHERGAFTGAHQLKIGKFEAADGGTIFLDEIGNLHPDLQAKLLHVLQDGEFSRVGGKSTIKVDARVLAATNQKLERAVADGRFREDLYYRLNVIHIELPPLRERLEEIPLLAQYFTERYAKLYQKKEAATVVPEVMERLLRYRYPGNVRELENVIKRMIVLGDPLLTPAAAREADKPPAPPAERPATPARSLKDIGRTAAHAAEHEAILRALEQTRWNRVKAAKLLKISYRALLYKIKDAGLDQDPRTLGTS
jgi:two-component system, NtrC family, response regulator AtoC